MKPYEALIGDIVSYEDLISASGKFYTVGGVGFCDTLTATFKLNPQKGGYERIE